VEEQFYLVWPFLLLCVRDLAQAKKLCVWAFLLSFVVRSVIWHWAGPDPSLVPQCGALAVGAYPAVCFRQPNVWVALQRSARYVAPVLLACFVAIALISTPTQESKTMYTCGTACVALLCGALLILAMGQGVTHRLMLMAPLRRLGTISYGFYVIHQLLRPLFVLITVTIVPNASLNAQAIVCALVAGGLTYLLATLSFRYFELPFLKLRGKFRVSPVAPILNVASRSPAQTSYGIDFAE
jgi:peptidoglycan/LPS O-acetylase OafA/YrhL